MVRRCGLRAVLLRRSPGCRPSIETAGQGTCVRCCPYRTPACDEAEGATADEAGRWRQKKFLAALRFSGPEGVASAAHCSRTPWSCRRPPWRGLSQPRARCIPHSRPRALDRPPRAVKAVREWCCTWWARSCRPWSADRFDGHGCYSRIFSWTKRSSLDIHVEQRTALEQRTEHRSKRKAARDGTTVTVQRHR